ncbi:hypothetical protein JCM1840_002590 [Sporobolomyces johnsonii]
MTTQTLYSRLHATGQPLPSRPPPPNFMRGAARSDPSRPVSRKPPTYPGQEESSNGRWSMSYLKRHVLAGMENRGEIVKLTRHKWETVAAAAGIPTKPVAADEPETTDDAVKAEPAPATATSKGKTQAQKKESDHIWVLKEAWLAASRKAAEGQPTKREKRDDKEERELREKYGLETAA